MKISNVWGLINNNNMRLRFRNQGSISERLSSGLKINRSADNPSGLAISTNARAAIGGIETAIQNIQDGIRMIHTADGGMVEINDLLQRGRDLAVRAANNATLTTADIAKMQNEVEAILLEIDKLALNTKYNTKELISGGSGPTYEQTTQADFQAGTYLPADIDLVSSPGDVKLEYNDWDTSGGVGLANENAVNLWLSSYVDNGDGTVTCTLQFDASKAGGGSVDYRGFLELDAGITGVTVTNNTGGTNVVYTGAGVFDFSSGGRLVRATNAAGTPDFQVQFTSKKSEASWRVKLNSPTGTTTRALYYDNNPVALRDQQLSYEEAGYFTDIVGNATFQSSAIDTDQVGGEATFSWNATTTGGNQIVMQLYEAAAAGGPWTALGTFENGDSFTYNQQFLRVEAVLSSSGIAFGSPELHDFSVQLKQGGTLQIGEDNNDLIYRKNLEPIDARAAGLGIANIDITALNKSIKVYDTFAEWQAGIVNSTGIDALSRPGDVLISSPISSKTGAQNNNAPNCYLFIESAIARPDGRFDVTMSCNMYGYNPPGLGAALQWLGSFTVADGSGAVQFDTAWTIDADGGTPGSVPLGVNNSTYRDGTMADATILANGSPGPSTAGPFNNITFDYATGGLKDGFGVTFTCDPDAVFTLNWECDGVYNAPGPANSRTPTGAADVADNVGANIFFGSDQITDDYGAGVGVVSISRRLAEYAPVGAPTGSFETAPVYFGPDADGMLGGVTNAGATQFEVQESADGIGGWTTILAAGSGSTNFTTSSNGNYVRVVSTLTGTAANLDLPPAPGAYAYTQSASPVLGSLTIQKDISPITEFNNAIMTLAGHRADLGIVERELNYVLNEANDQRINLMAANSRILDADIASEYVDLTRNGILTQSTVAVIAQGDTEGGGVLGLIDAQGIGPSIAQNLKKLL